MSVNINFADLSLLVSHIVSSQGRVVTENGIETWAVELHGIPLSAAFSGQEDMWIVKGAEWKLSFMFDTSQRVDETCTLPNLAQFGIWGLVEKAAFTGSFDAYERDATLLKIVLPRSREIARRVVEVETSNG